MAFDTSKLNSIYQNNLGRDAKQSGIDYWKSQYDNLGWDGIESNVKAGDEAKKYLSSQSGSSSSGRSSGGLLNGGSSQRSASSSTPRTSSSRNTSASSRTAQRNTSSSTNSGFDASRLNQIYQQQFGRDADAAGADYWRQQYDTLGMDGIEWNIKQQAGQSGGGTQASNGKATFQDAKAALEAASQSTDTNSVLQYMSSVNRGETTLGGTGGGNNAPTDRDRLNQIFQDTLGRDVDAAGADYWLSQVGEIGWDGVANQIRQGGEYASGVPSRFTPTQVNSNQTAAGQLNNMLASDSKLMQRAATQGQQAANNRGLLNSSMAAEAAQGAMIDRASPIARQDAQTNFQASQADADRQQQMRMADREFGYNQALSSQDAQQALERLKATSTANGWGVMANNMTDIIGQYSSQVERIQMNPDIQEADKASMIEQVLEMRDADIDFQRSMYDQLPDYLANTGVFPDLA